MRGRLVALGAVLLTGCMSEQDAQDQRDSVARMRECQARGGEYTRRDDAPSYFAKNAVCLVHRDSLIPLTGKMP